MHHFLWVNSGILSPSGTVMISCLDCTIYPGNSSIKARQPATEQECIYRNTLITTQSSHEVCSWSNWSTHLNFTEPPTVSARQLLKCTCTWYSTVQSPTKLDYILRWKDTLQKTSSQQKTRVYRITESIRLERTLKTIQFQFSCYGQGCQPPDHAAQGPIHPRLKYL